MKKLFFLLTLLLCTSMAWAHDVEVNGIFYNLNQTNKTATVTFKGVYSDSYDNEYSGEVVIPENFIYDGITYSVTSLGDYCFSRCTGLTSITIPNSVTSLGGSCFSGCTGLTSITIPNSVTSLCSGCFADCARLESIEVESGNTVYDSRENCNAIIETSSNTMIAGCKNTTIPNSVTSLGYDCFSGCTGLTSITIPNSVTSLGDYCFEDCSGLTNIKMKSSTPPSTSFWAFSGCSSLTTVYVPKGAKEAYNVKPWNSYEIVEMENTSIAAAPTVDSQKASAPVYGLNGRRIGTADAMDALPKGVYIVNGKKVMK